MATKAVKAARAAVTRRSHRLLTHLPPNLTPVVQCNSKFSSRSRGTRGNHTHTPRNPTTSTKSTRHH
jgi:hypothetical protein